MPVSRIGKDLAHDTTFSDVTVGLGFRNNLGAWVDTALNVPVVSGASVGPDLGSTRTGAS